MQIQNSLRHNATAAKMDKAVKEFKERNLPVLLPILQNILLDGYNLLGKKYGFTDLTKDLEALERRYVSQGIGFIQKSLPDLFNGALQYLETGVSCYPGFKLQKGTEYPRFCRRIFAMIYNSTSFEDTAAALKILYQLCSAFKKLEGPYPHDVLSRSMADFVATDQSWNRIDLTKPALKVILQHATACITQLFSGYTGYHPAELPRPGSGATNTPVEKDLRYRPHFLYEQLNSVYDYDTWYNTPYQYIFGDVAVQYTDELRYDCNVVDYPVSRFKYINKKLGTPRGICIEEAEPQFFQQGLRSLLYWWIEHHPKTKGRVNFSDQSINQELALRSSITREKATIDMSEASDRVFRELVLMMFHKTLLFDKLEAVSTKFIQLPTGLGQNESLMANKFAPMGSGVCFPVMSLVHWALIQGIIASSNLQDSYKLCREVYVYGDDIIVPSECAELVYKYLPMFGMKINVEKSYVASHFRESCGCHAYGGVDITPAFFKKVITKATQHSDSSTLISLISKEYRLRRNGFTCTADYLVDMVHKHYGKLPKVHKDSSIVGWKQDDAINFDALMPFCSGVKRHGEDPQQHLYKFKVVRTFCKELPCLQDDRGYFRHQTMFTEDSRVVSGEPDDSRIVWSWIPEPALPKRFISYAFLPCEKFQHRMGPSGVNVA